jgi:uncharacterized protein DUF3352
MLTRVRALVLALVAAAALGLSACGGGGGGVSSDDPASLAPANSPVYVQATIRPTGSLKTDVESLAKAVSGLPDPTAQLISEFEKAVNAEGTLSGHHLNFAKDVEPWLGNKAGLFLAGFGHTPDAAGIVQTTDPKATQKFIADQKQKGDTDQTYHGVDYVLDKDGKTAAGVVGDFLVLGNEKGFKDAVDASQGADVLGDQSDFTDALDQAPSGSISDVYVNLEVVQKAVRATSPQSVGGLQAALGDLTGKSALVSFVPSADSLEVDLATNANPNFQLTDLSSLIGTFPADSFVALGIPDLGKRIAQTVDQLKQAGVVNGAALDQQLSTTGLTLDDITGALGDLGIFVEGTDRASLQGAGVITSSSSSKLRNVISTISSLAAASGQPGVTNAQVGNGFRVVDPRQIGPQALTVTSVGDKLVVGYGDKATQQAASGGGATLADDPTYKQALSAIGSGLAGYVSLSKVFQLADSLGAIKDPGYQQARPYLDKLSYAAIGSSKSGDWQTTKVIVGVR